MSIIGNANNGHTFQGAALPFGLVQASPEMGNSGWQYCSGFVYVDTTRQSVTYNKFRFTHIYKL